MRHFFSRSVPSWAAMGLYTYHSIMKKYSREYTMAVIQPLQTRYIYIQLVTDDVTTKQKKIMADKPGLSHEAGNLFKFCTTYLEDVFSSP